MRLSSQIKKALFNSDANSHGKVHIKNNQVWIDLDVGGVDDKTAAKMAGLESDHPRLISVHVRLMSSRLGLPYIDLDGMAKITSGWDDEEPRHLDD